MQILYKSVIVLADVKPQRFFLIYSFIDSFFNLKSECCLLFHSFKFLFFSDWNVPSSFRGRQ